MSTFINLLDVVYPVGSIYMSNDSTSPATLFGGTWDAVKGGLLACAGSDGYAASGSTGGSKTISISQMPNHTHTSNSSAVIFNMNGSVKVGSGSGAQFYQDYLTVQGTGGGRIIFLRISPSMFGSAQHKIIGGGVDVIFH